MKRYAIITAAVAVAAFAAALAAGGHRVAALVGALAATVPAAVALPLFQLAARSRQKIVERALAAFTALFFLRLAFIVAGLFAVHRMGGSPLAFVVAFFVPYFAYQVIEGFFVHALGKQQKQVAA